MKSFTINNSRLNNFDIIFSIIYLFGLYSGISFYISDELYIPYIPCGIAAIYFLIYNFNALKFKNILPILYLSFVTLLGIIFSDHISEYDIERMKGFIQLIYSMFLSFIFYLNLKKWNPHKLCRLFIFFIFFILIGAILEIYTDFKEISDNFRNIVFRSNLYNADLRDIYFYGIIRPKLFTEEPSHVAKFYTLCLFVWFSLSNHKYRYIILFILTSIGLFLIRSPILLIIVPISYFIEIFLRKNLKFKIILKRKRVILEKSLAVIIVFLTILGLYSFNTVLEKRLTEIASGNDDSFNLRFLGPGLIAIEVLKEYPIWGAGVTGKEAISGIIDEVYYKINVNYYSIHSFSTNIAMSFLIYYGLLGGILFGLGVIFLLKRLQINHKFFILITFLIFGQTMGAFVGLRPWGYFFVIVSVTHFFSLHIPNISTNFLGSCQDRLSFPQQS